MNYPGAVLSEDSESKEVVNAEASASEAIDRHLILLVLFLRFLLWRYLEVEEQNGVVEQDKHSILPEHTIFETSEKSNHEFFVISEEGANGRLAHRKKLKKTKESICSVLVASGRCFFSVIPKNLVPNCKNKEKKLYNTNLGGLYVSLGHYCFCYVGPTLLMGWIR